VRYKTCIDRRGQGERAQYDAVKIVTIKIKKIEPDVLPPA